jgi:protein tyrosine/serine phosphatase
MNSNEMTIPNAYWVLPGKLLAGGYPGALQESEARRRLRWLLEQGITLSFDLTGIGETLGAPYERWLQEEADALGRTMNYCHIPIEDMGTPSHEEMIDLLDALDAALEVGQTVYLHCHGGLGRTGTVVGCYLVRHGRRGEEALTEIARLRGNLPSGRARSPETGEQREMVLNWKE